MNRPKSNKPATRGPNSGVAHDGVQEPQRIPEERRLIERREAYQGPVPPPDILERFELLVPGTAKRLFDLAEQESLHRRKIEDRTSEANIAAQQKALEIELRRTNAIARSDSKGQTAGILVSMACIGGAIWCALLDHEKVAIALTVIPSAAVIQAFFSRRNAAKPREESR